MLQRVKLYFFGFTDLLLSFCFDGINKKTKQCPLSAALLSFGLVYEISLWTPFQTFLKRDFVTALYLISFFFCHQAICIHCLLHLQPNIFIWKNPGHIWCADTSDLLGANVSNSVSSIVLSVVATAVGEWLWVCWVFLATNGSSSLLQGFGHKTVV